jgi:predicted metal-binding protein
VKRPVLEICSRCRTDEEWDGWSFFLALKEERKARALKPVLKLKETKCLGGCDTPCNAELYGKGRPTLRITWLHGVADVVPLLEGARRYAESTGDVTHASLRLPGRPAPD